MNKLYYFYHTCYPRCNDFNETHYNHRYCLSVYDYDYNLVEHSVNLSFWEMIDLLGCTLGYYPIEHSHYTLIDSTNHEFISSEKFFNFFDVECRKLN